MTTINDLFRDEGPEERAEREAEEAKDRLFIERLRIANAQRIAAREAEVARIREANCILETATPALKFDIECQRAVAGTDLQSQRAAPPALGGLPPGQAEDVARRQERADRAWEAEQQAREKWLENQADALKDLQAGQEPTQQASIKAQIHLQKG